MDKDTRKPVYLITKLKQTTIPGLGILPQFVSPTEPQQIILTPAEKRINEFMHNEPNMIT